MAKTASFGVLHLATSFGVGYALTGSVAIAGAVSLVEPLVNTAMHYVFERYWEHPRIERVRARMARRWRGRVDVQRGRVSRSSEDSQAIA